jgi:hypothetical protein
MPRVQRYPFIPPSEDAQQALVISIGDAANKFNFTRESDVLDPSWIEKLLQDPYLSGLIYQSW